MYTVYKKDTLVLFAGVVDGNIRDYNKDGKVAKIVKLKDYKGETIDIFFFNSSAENASKADMRADRIVNAKVAPGAFLTVLAKRADENAKSATGIDFKYKGMWTLKNGEKNVTVLMGTACKPREPKKGMYCITIPIDESIDGQKSTKWIDVTFFDGEKDDKKWSNATFASKVMYQEEKPLVVAIGGDITERTVDGRLYYSIVGYGITKRPKTN